MRGEAAVREEGEVAVSEANKDIVRRYQEAYNTNNLDLLDELLDPNWKTNAWPQGIPQSIEAAKEFYSGGLQTFPDLHFITFELVAEGDWVVQRSLLRGTFKNPFGDLPPTGQVVEAGTISMFRIAGGKIVEHWAYADDTSFFKALGVDVPEIMFAFPHRSPAVEGDTT
jgi:predicted ester cyclase